MDVLSWAFVEPKDVRNIIIKASCFFIGIFIVNVKALFRIPLNIERKDIDKSLKFTNLADYKFNLRL